MKHSIDAWKTRGGRYKPHTKKFEDTTAPVKKKTKPPIWESEFFVAVIALFVGYPIVFGLGVLVGMLFR